MRSINCVTISGNLTRDPEERVTPAGMHILDFSVAVNWSTKQQDGSYKDEPSFIDCVCFGKTAEHLAQNLSKGQRVHVAGRLRQRSWEGRDGSKRSKVEVVADQVEYDKGGRAKPSANQYDVMADEDIPF